MKLYIKKNFIINLIGIVLLKLSLDYIYIIFISKIFAYEGFYLNINISKYIESWIALIIIFILLKRLEKHILYITLLLIYILLIIPTITLYGLRDEPSWAFYSMIIPYIIMLLLISTKKVKLRYIAHSKAIAIIISVIVVGVVLIHYILSGGLSHINFDLSKVYELRESDYGISSNSGVFGYINSWATKVFNIFLISIAFLKKKYFYAIIFIFIQVLLFALSGHKIVLFSLILLVGLYFIDKAKNQYTIIIYGILIFILLLLGYFYIFNEIILPSILLRRTFFLPSYLNYVYLDYFSSNPHIYWSNSILKYFISYPYNVAPEFVIGSYLGHPAMGANTGIFGSGYMHLGIIGILIYSFVMVLILNLVQQFQKLPKWLINSIMLIPLLSAFISSDLLVSILTHGIFVSLLVLYLYSASSKKGV